MSDSLHWLSFPQQVTFKLCLMTYKYLHGLAPTYLSQCCVPVAAVTGRSRLRSADDRMLYVLLTQTIMHDSLHARSGHFTAALQTVAEDLAYLFNTD